MPLNYQNWINRSSQLGRGRSADLVQVDQAVTQFGNGPSVLRLQQLADAILDWRAAKGNWTTSIRAADMRELINLVKAESRVRWPEASGQIFSYRQCVRVIHLLQANPQVFLNQNVMVIAGSPNGPRQFRLLRNDNDAIFENDDLVGALTPPGQPWYGLATANRGPAIPMESVAMHQDITNVSGLATVEGRFHPIGAPLLTTGQITGCVFIMRRNPIGNVFECTHIQPNPANWPGDAGAGGMNLQTYLQGLGIAGNPTFWGRHNYGVVPPSLSLSVVGIRGGGGLWNVYAQRYDRTTKALLGVDHILVNG